MPSPACPARRMWFSFESRYRTVRSRSKTTARRRRRAHTVSALGSPADDRRTRLADPREPSEAGLQEAGTEILIALTRFCSRGGAGPAFAGSEPSTLCVLPLPCAPRSSRAGFRRGAARARATRATPRRRACDAGARRRQRRHSSLLLRLRRPDQRRQAHRRRRSSSTQRDGPGSSS